MPQGVRSLLQARLSAADDTARQLLAAAAVIGRSFDFDTLRAASGRSEEETIACLEQLVRKGLVREATTNTTGAEPGYDFSHEQLRALVKQALKVPEKTQPPAAYNLLGESPAMQQVRGLIASEARNHYMEGVDLQQFVHRLARAGPCDGGRALHRA